MPLYQRKETRRRSIALVVPSTESGGSSPGSRRPRLAIPRDARDLDSKCRSPAPPRRNAPHAAAPSPGVLLPSKSVVYAMRPIGPPSGKSLGASRPALGRWRNMAGVRHLNTQAAHCHRCAPATNRCPASQNEFFQSRAEWRLTERRIATISASVAVLFGSNFRPERQRRGC
jgi:hypothetical protein